MSYTAQITRNQPTCIIFLIDQSGSMSEAIAGTANKSKANGVADAVNKLLGELVDKCTKDLGMPPRDYFDIAVIGYGKSVGPAFGGKLAGRQWAKISDIADNPLRVESRPEGNFAVWFDAVSGGGTPMCKAITMVRDLLNIWISSHPDSFPPIIVNITDGESTDGEPLLGAEEIQKLSTNDGSVLFFNCDVSASAGSKVLFPDSDASLPDVKHERNLFKMSSELPAKMLTVAQKEVPGVVQGARGFAFQADFSELVMFLEIGTAVDANIR